MRVTMKIIMKRIIKITMKTIIIQFKIIVKVKIIKAVMNKLRRVLNENHDNIMKYIMNIMKQIKLITITIYVWIRII